MTHKRDLRTKFTGAKVSDNLEGLTGYE